MSENLNNLGFEKHENLTSRSIEIYMVRHGKQESYEDPQSRLGAEGEAQARQFADELVENCRPENGVVIKVKRSSQERASKTAEIIEKELRDKITELNLTNIRVLNTRDSGNLKTTGALGPIMKAGVKYEDSVDEWLENSDKYPEAKKPEEAASQIKSMVESADHLAKKINTNGPKIIYIWVTHETGHAALLKELTGKNTKELGGSIGHLESMKIIVAGDKEPQINFRGQEYNLSINKNGKT